MQSIVNSLNAAAESWWSWMTLASWQGAALAAIMLLIVVCARRWPAPVRHALLVLVLVKFLVPPTWTAPTGLFSRVEVERAHSVAAVEETGTSHGVLLAAGTVNPDTTSDPGGATWSAPATDRAIAEVGEAEIAWARPARVADAEPAATSLSGYAVTMLAWAVGVLAFGVLVARAFASLRAQLRHATSAPDDVFARHADLARRLGLRRVPTLSVSPEGQGPLAYGVLRPGILIPREVLALAPLEQDAVLAHELAHHRRRDMWSAWLQHVVGALFWFHPAVWATNRFVKRLREDCCDDVVLTQDVCDDERYCETLLRTACFIGVTNSAAAAGLGAHPLHRRFRRILDPTLVRSPRLGAMGAAVALVVGAFVMPGIAVVNAPEGRGVPGADVVGSEVVWSGTVLLPDGKPASGAKVWFMSTAKAKGGRIREHPLRATTGDDGRFTVACSRDEFDYPNWQDHVQFVATLDGYGMAILDVDAPAAKTGLVLRLAEDMPLKGRILDLEGRVVKGATFRVLRLRANADNDVMPYFKELGDGEISAGRPPRRLFPMSMRRRFEDLPGAKVAADADGRFEVRGLGKGRFVVGLVEAPALATQTMHAVLTTEEVPEAKLFDNLNQGVSILHPPTFEFIGMPTQVVVGTVRHAKTKAPVPDTEVASVRWFNMDMDHRMAFMEASTYIKAKTDAQGRFRLVGLPRLDEGFVEITPPEGSGLLPGTRKVAIPREGPTKIDVDLAVGTPLTFVVTDAKTGRPIVDARLNYHVERENPNRVKLGLGQGYGVVRQTNAKGEVDLLGVPGDGVVSVRAREPHYFASSDRPGLKKPTRPIMFFFGGTEHAIDRVIVTDDPKSHRISVKLWPAPEVVVRLQDQDGRPLEGVRVWDRAPSTDWTKITGSEVSLVGFNPKRPRKVAFHHEPTNLGGLLEIDASAKAPYSFKLKKLARLTVRLVDEYGKPRPNVRLDVDMPNYMGDFRMPRTVPYNIKTDADGRIVLENLMPGLSYDIVEDRTGKRYEDYRRVGRYKLKAGEDLDAGDVESKRLR